MTACFKSTRTLSGIFYAGRCAECATVHGGENAGMIALKPRDADTQINDWK
jgi:hypothetical protein